MSPQMTQTYRGPGGHSSDRELHIRGAAGDRQRDTVDPDATADSDDDVPPRLEPIDLDPPLPITGRAPNMSPRRFTIFRAQGSSTNRQGVDIGTEVPPGRRSRLSHWSPPSSEDDAPPALEGPPPFSLPWSRPPLGTVTRIEQYLSILVDGRRLFFRISINIERTPTTMHPDVSVVFVDHAPFDRSFRTDVWVLFAGRFEANLLREVERAFQAAAARNSTTGV